MKEVLAQLKDIDRRTDAYILTFQIWQPGDSLADVALEAVALTLQGVKPE